MRILYGFGRAILGGFFLYNGIGHFTSLDSLTGYAAAKNTPSPRFDVAASGVLLAATGASLVFGMKPRLGALGAIGFLAIATPMMHDFWAQKDEQARQHELTNFLKNTALLGASVALLGAEGGSNPSEPCDQAA
jgi:putative oxidoreductase